MTPSKYILDDKKTSELIKYHADLGLPLDQTVKFLLAMYGTNLSMISQLSKCRERDIKEMLNGCIPVPSSVRDSFRELIGADPWEASKVNTYPYNIRLPQILSGSQHLAERVSHLFETVPPGSRQKCLDEFNYRYSFCKEDEKSGIRILYEIVKSMNEPPSPHDSSKATEIQAK